MKRSEIKKLALNLTKLCERSGIDNATFIIRTDRNKVTINIKSANPSKILQAKTNPN